MPLRPHTTSRRTVTYLCVAVLLLAAVLPGVAAMDYVVPSPGWVILPAFSPAPPVRPVLVAVEQVRSLAASLPPRAPPRA
jgi:hypothetical protein